VMATDVVAAFAVSSVFETTGVIGVVVVGTTVMDTAGAAFESGGVVVDEVGVVTVAGVTGATVTVVLVAALAGTLFVTAGAVVPAVCEWAIVGNNSDNTRNDFFIILILCSLLFGKARMGPVMVIAFGCDYEDFDWWLC